MTDELFRKMDEETLILTANSRLARYLQTNFESYQQDAQKIAWETPRIIPMQAWLEQQFHRHNTTGKRLLTPFQESCLWQEVITQSQQASDILQPTQLSSLVMQAADILTLWCVDIAELRPFEAQPEVKYLIDWITRFNERCVSENWITQAQLPHTLLSVDKITPLQLPSSIILMGFDDFTPAVNALLSALQSRTSIQTQWLKANTTENKRVILGNREAEIKTMAQWAKAKLSHNPAATIGCVIPDLGNIRTIVERIFTDTLPKESINISAGAPLANQPMVQVALTLLKWCHTELPIEALSSLLQSPYLCSHESEKNKGSQMDAQLRQKNKMTVNIRDLFSLTPAISSWRGYLEYYSSIASSLLSPSKWAQHFIGALKIIGWPSSNTQSSTEFQVLERFKKTLVAFSQLDFIYPTLNFKRALYLLSSLTQQTLFQPKSHQEPIQIMGALEAGGMVFDALWVMGMHDGAWPPATKPHPLIPFALQQQYQMPHATGKRELQYCEQMTERLATAATQVIFSSPAKEGDQDYFPSRLIHSVPLVDSEELQLDTEKSVAEKIFESRCTETCEDNQASALTQFSDIHGGSSILKNQAECPFLAFATIRLKGKALDTPTIGLSPMTQGNLIHDTLFELWGELKDQAGLKEYSNDELNTLIEATIESVFSKTQHKSDKAHHIYFWNIEKKRMVKIIHDWLRIEKYRPAFRVVAREISCQITVNQLPIKIRMDRIDALEDGSLFLMDYKTGKKGLSACFDERLQEPQLPLYATFQGNAEHGYTAIGFAKVNQKEMGFEVITQEDHPYSKSSIDGFASIDSGKYHDTIFSWDNLVTHWKKSLEKLADDFCNGVATVDPASTKVCQNCELKPLCRYRE
jgi:ATP-dependent helicase/nuclease subunit B